MRTRGFFALALPGLDPAIDCQSFGTGLLDRRSRQGKACTRFVVASGVQMGCWSLRNVYTMLIYVTRSQDFLLSSGSYMRYTYAQAALLIPTPSSASGIGLGRVGDDL